MQLCMNPLWYSHKKSFNDIKRCAKFHFSTKFSIISCYTVNIHLEKWLMRRDTKRAIWWDLYNKQISIFCIKNMSTIFRTLHVNKWSKRFSHFARWMLLNLLAKINFTHYYILLYGFLWLYHYDYSWFMYDLIWFWLYHAVEENILYCY